MWASRRKGGVGWAVAQAAGRPRTVEAEGAGHARGAHPKHPRHVCDAGRVEAQRLVERRRLLPIRKGQHRRRGNMRASRRKGRAGGVVASSREGPTMEVEGRARAERTENIDAMLVTLDVSRLSGWLNAFANCRVERGSIGGGATCGQAGGRVGWGGRWRKQQGGLGLWRLRAGHARSTRKTCSSCL